MDYTTVKGIHQRTGVDKDLLILFVLKELLDNAVDFIEKFGRSGQQHIVKVTLTKGKIIVANSNFGIEPFTPDMLNKIFNFSGFYSEKRNIHNISRGYLGDALKEVLCVPYALADSDDIEYWNEPLVITGNNASYHIRPNINRVENKIKPQIVNKPRESTENITDIEFHFPDQQIDLNRDLVNVLIDYGILNPHITFHFKINFPDSKNGSIYREFDKLLKPTQKINSDWTNRPSAWYYNLDEFKQFINGLENNEAIIYDVLRDLKFKEITNIGRDGVMIKTTKELKSNPKTMARVYHQLRDAMGFTANTKVKTQFDVNRQVRRDAIKKRIEQFGFNVSNTKYRLVHDTYEAGDGGVKFPFIFEIGMFYTSQPSSYVVDGINSSYRPTDPFRGKYTNTYTWFVGRKEDKEQSASTVQDILAKYGYSSSKKRSRKPSAFIVVNLISPRIDFEGYGKERINLGPFADTIAQTVYKIASESAPVSSGESRLSGKDIVREILEKRRLAVKQNKDLLITDKWTQSSVFYRARKRMLEKGVRLTERKTITQQISDICTNEWEIKRESIGVFAADRAQLYFRGKVHDVGIRELDELKQRGTDLIIIEKEGVAEVLSPFAEKYGIAILNTRGFLTDYATELSKLSEHVTVLSDLDDSGLLIATKVPGVPRIGIDLETLEHFGLDRETVEEEYKPGDHYTSLKSLSDDGRLDPKIDELLPEIETTRIEIDSILVEVGNAAFWNFVLEKIGKLWETRNYTRAIQPPKGIVPDIIENLNKALRKKCNEVAANKRKEIEDGLEDYEGFITDVDKKDEEIEGEIKDVLAENEEIKSLLADVEALKKKYPFLAVAVDDKDDDRRGL